MNKKLLSAMTDIDDDLIIAAGKKNGRDTGLWLSIVATAACMCILFSAVITAMPKNIYAGTDDLSGDLSYSVIHESSDNASNDGSQVSDEVSVSTPVIIDTPAYSAYEIAELFPSMGLSSNSVQAFQNEIYIPDKPYLNSAPAPTDEYTEICDATSGKALDKDELKTFAVETANNLSSMLDVAAPEFNIKLNSYGQEYYASEKAGDYYAAVTQSGVYNKLFIGSLNSYSSDTHGITLDDRQVTVDPKLADAEIALSFKEVGSRLSSVMAEKLDDISVTRSYSGSGEDPLQSLTVYIYDASYGINQYTGVPNSDYITVVFDNSKPVTDTAADTKLGQASIAFYQNRMDLSERNKVICMQKLISLDEAEAQLESGRIFGVHVCPLCITEKSGLMDYDAVSFEYVTSKTLSVPFYVFYKITGTAKNGMLICARAYVPAVELKDTDEYFESQINRHIAVSDNQIIE